MVLSNNRRNLFNSQAELKASDWTWNPERKNDRIPSNIQQPPRFTMANVGDETTKKLDHRMGMYHLQWWVSNGKNHCVWQSELLTHKLPWHQICARICPSSGYSIIHPNECLAAAESFLPFLMETSLLAAIQQLENTHRNSPHLGL